jgi:tRNA threonylcarbamoyladenosine biosynthesis protein TsaB
VPDFAAPLILSLETATRTGGVALTSGSQLLALRAGEAQTSHSMKLLHSIEEMLEETGISLQDVELYAAASGPGSFTGLRIGLATIKSFAATLSRSCVGIPTLSAIAFAAGPSPRTLAMMPAGRGEVFAQPFSVGESGEVTSLGKAVHQTPEKLLDGVVHLNQLKLAGEGVQQHELLIEMRAKQEGISLVYEEESDNEVVDKAVIDVEKQWLVTLPVKALAVDIAALAYLDYQNGATLKPEQLQAIYVRPSDAELNTPER